MPSAIQGASAPAVSNGLNSLEEPTPPKPAVMTATASSATAPTRIAVDRLIGPRERPRSVRYQCPSNNPSSTAPRNAAPASSWNNATPDP
jgi:hypothetical protein